jgi:basic membrane protein A
MNLKKILSIFLILPMIFLSGCKSEEIVINSDLSIGFIANGSIEDKDKNQYVWEGLKSLRNEFDIKISYIEAKQEDDYIISLESMIADECDLIICIGEDMVDSLIEVANIYTSNQFAIIDATITSGNSNIAQVNFKEEEGAYLAGVIAANITETNEIGFIADLPTTINAKYMYGFKAGLESVNPKIRLTDKYTNEIWDNNLQGKIARELYENNIDIIFSTASNAGIQTIEVAKELNKLAIGTDRDKRDIAPDNFLTSVVKRYDMLTIKMIEDFSSDKLNFGRTENRYGIEEESIALCDGISKHISEELAKEIEDISEEIKKDEIEIPKSKSEYNSLNKVNLN